VDDQTTVDTAAAAEQAAPPPVEKPKPIVVPAGTVLTVKIGQALGSKTSQAGQTFMATLAQPVSVGGRKALPAGATASGTVVNAKAKGKIKGQGELELKLTSISVGGHTYPIQTNSFSSTEKGKGKRTAVATGGAAAGLIGGTFTGNKQIELPAESALSFTLAAPLTLPPGE
jgi:hypothetical protein